MNISKIKAPKRTGVASLNDSIADLTIIKRQIESEMKSILRQAQGNRAVIVPPSMFPIIQAVFTEFKKTMGVKFIYSTETVKPVQTAEIDNYFFFHRSHDFVTMQKIAKQIRFMKGDFDARYKESGEEKKEEKKKVAEYSFMEDPKKKKKKKRKEKVSKKKSESKIKIFVFSIPRSSVMNEHLFNEYRALDRIHHIGSFGLDIVPVDTDLATQFIPRSYFHMKSGNTDICYNSARAILKLESMYGKIPVKNSIGSYALMTLKILSSLSIDLEEHGKDKEDSDGESSSEIEFSDEDEDKKKKKKKGGEDVVFDELIIIDRGADHLTPLLTPMTYEAMLSHFFGITERGRFEFLKHIDVDPIIEYPKSEKEGGNKKKKKKKKKRRNKNDDDEETEGEDEEVDENQFPKPKKDDSNHLDNFEEVIFLNQDDGVYKKLRNKNLKFILNHLQECINENQEVRNEFQKKSEESGNQLIMMGNFVKNELPKLLTKDNDIKHHKKVYFHLKKLYQKKVLNYMEIEKSIITKEMSVKNEILKELEKMILTQEKLSKVLNVIVLMSMMDYQMDMSHFENFESAMITSYGMAVLIVVRKLRELGILCLNSKKKQATKNSPDYNSLKKKLGLFETEWKNIKGSIHYVFNGSNKFGYAAVSIRLIQELLKRKQGLFRSIEKTIPCSLVVEEEKSSSNNYNNWMEKDEEFEESGRERKNVLVFFVGGVCRGEIASLRFMQQKFRCKFMICATEILNDFMKQFTII